MRNAAVVLVSIVCIFVGHARVVACTCAGREPPLKAFEESTAVFAGTAIASFDSLAQAPIISSADPIVYTLLVTHVWKGSVADTLQVVSERDGASCGFQFVIGDQYLVYAYRRQGRQWTSECSRTARIFHTTWDRYALPEPLWTRKGESWEQHAE